MIKYTGKVVYFADPAQDVQEEYDRYVTSTLETNGLEFLNVECTDTPPFIGASNEKSYDILLFDWGGMSIGNSLLENFCRQILKEAEDCPSRTYVMTSQFTLYAMEEAFEEFGEDRPRNVFLSIEEFAEEFKKLYKIQEDILEE